MLGLGLGLGLQRRTPAIAAGPPAWSPVALFAGGAPGIWWDMSDRSTLYQDAAGTIPVTSDGDPVGLMLDKSGRSNHARQTVPSKRPAWRTDGRLCWLKFDGADDFLLVDMLDLSVSNQVTGIGGFMRPGGSVQEVVCFGYSSASNPMFYYGFDSSPRFWNCAYKRNGVFYLTFDNKLPSDAFVGAFLIDNPGAEVITSINGVNGVGAAVPANSDTVGSMPLYIGNYFGSGYNYSGALYSLILVGTSLDGAARGKAETWMAAKSGVTL